MTLAKRIHFAVLGRVLQLIGVTFYIGGAAISIGIIAAGHKVSRIRPFSDLLIAVSALILGFIVAFILLYSGHLLLLYGKRKTAKAKTLRAQELSARVKRSPVLYLRSFDADQVTSATPIAEAIRGVHLPMLSTEEEHLAGAVCDIGPFLAFGKPNEILPPTGAVRVLANGQSWKQTVLDLMSQAQLIIFRVGDGKWLWWEIERAIEIVQLKRILFLIPKDDSVFQNFRQSLQKLVPQSIPDFVDGEALPTTIGAILYFGPDGKPYLNPLKNAGYRTNQWQPLRPILRIALKPIFGQLKLKWTPPPIPLQAILYALFFAWVLGICLYWLFVFPPWELLKGWSRLRLGWLILYMFFYFFVLIIPLALASYGFLQRISILYFAITRFKYPYENLHIETMPEPAALSTILNGESVESLCQWSQRAVIGIAYDFKAYCKQTDYRRKHSIIGYMCPACRAVSHKESTESGIRFSWWSGYEKSKCRACEENIPTPHIIIQKEPA